MAKPRPTGEPEETASLRAEETAGPRAEPAEAPGPQPVDRPEMDGNPVPKLVSWPAVVLLWLGPFIFIPFFRQTFPYFGLWPAALTLAASLHLLRRGISRWDRLLAKAGLVLAGLAFAAFWVGVIVLPVLLSLSQAGVVFGWARPVPVDPARFRNARRGRLAVSLAGVMTNLGLAVFCGCALQVLGILLHLRYPGLTSQGFAIPGERVIFTGLPNPALWQLLAELLKAGLLINMILFSLNILPVPPLDGFGVVEGLMPDRIRSALQTIRPLGMVILLLLFMTKTMTSVLWPGLIGATVLNVVAGLAAKLG